MKLVTKIAAGILLGIGIPISLAATVEILNPRTIPQEREESIVVLIFLGLPPTALGGWMVVVGRHKSQKEVQDSLQSAFFKLIRQHDGRITPLSFAMETGVSGDVAREYLDQKVKEFGANFDVDSQGNMFYIFATGNTGEKALPLPVNEPTVPQPLRNTVAGQVEANRSTFSPGGFDVILEAVPDRNKIAAIKVVRELTGFGLKESKDLVEALPAKVQVGVDEIVARRCQQQLERIGATVMVMPGC